MGGAVSTGVDNDHLIDNLIEANFIKTPLIEKVFRSVDRAFYFLPEFRKAAYKDLAWKHGNLHLSAPCIYSKVLEELNLQPGQSFLNIGSGTGYLSTMVGMILGPFGINHGIEIHKEVVDYAYKKLEQFKKQCSAVDVFEFCEPYFIVGNGFHLQTDRKYDRIYCGAACPTAFHDNIKQYLKIGGVLIVPCDDDLLKFVRKSQNTWEVKPVLQVSFSVLQIPEKKSSYKSIEFESTTPLCLQSLCRSSIRTTIRSVCEKDDPELTRPRDKPVKDNRRRKYNTERHLVIPIFENLSGTDAVSTVNNRANGRLNFGRLIFHNYSSAGFQNFIRNLTRDDEDEDDDLIPERNTQAENKVGDSENRSDTSSGGENGSSDAAGVCDETATSSSDVQEDAELISDSETCSSTPKEKQVLYSASFERNRKNVTANCSDNSRLSNSRRDTNDATAGTSRKVFEMGECSYSLVGTANDEDAAGVAPKSHELSEQADAKASTTRTTTTKSDDDEEEENDDDYCGSQPKKIPKREKLDSGISEESDEGKISASNESSYSESTFSEAMDVESDDSDFSDYSSIGETRLPSDLDFNDSKFDTDESKTSVKYRMALEKRIQALPLPNPIKMYLNYDREFRFPC